MRRFKGCLFFAIALLLSGCVETKQVYHVNPNGSGKVRNQATFSQMRIQTNARKEADLEGPSRKDCAQMYEHVHKLINKTEGVKAWDSIQIRVKSQCPNYFPGCCLFIGYLKASIPVFADFARHSVG